MSTVRFQTTIGRDRVIHLPPDLEVHAGEAEVIILQPAPPEDAESPSLRGMADRLGRLAEELGIHGLPADLAENHDHYLHGTAKGIDKS